MPVDQRLAWVEETTQNLEAYPKAPRYLVGVSGGVDSRVLLQILFDTGLSNLVICHLDHRLRGIDSEREPIDPATGHPSEIADFSGSSRGMAPQTFHGNRCSPSSSAFLC